jgi:hypothetical protein
MEPTNVPLAPSVPEAAPVDVPPVDHAVPAQGAQDPAVVEGGVVDEGHAAASAETAAVAPVAATVAVEAPSGPRQYSSLYDTKATTVAAILFGVLIVGGIQYIVARMYAHAKNEQEYLTRFVTALVALVMGAYIADLLIAGPDTSLLSPEEHLTILGFVKDVCLMVFAYFFGTKSASNTSSSSGSEG